jgi:hypothetical protein
MLYWLFKGLTRYKKRQRPKRSRMNKRGRRSLVKDQNKYSDTWLY